MENHTNYRELLKVIRMQPVACPMKEEVRYRDISFRQYTGSNRELGLLCGPVAQKLSDADAVCRLMAKLEKSDIACNNLAGFSQRLIDLFSACIKQEPYTAYYCNPLLDSLQSLNKLSDTLLQKVQQPLLGELKNYFSIDESSGTTWYVDSRIIEDIGAVMKSYLEDILQQYNYFSRHAHFGPLSDGKAVTTISQAEQYLLSLVSLIEKLIRHTETTIDQLEEWQIRLSVLEMQERYN